MKKFTMTFLIAVLFISCGKDDANSESVTFRNSTSFNVIVSPYDNLLNGAPTFNFPIAPGETKTYETEYFYGIFQVNSDETEKNFNYQFQGDTRVIYDFDYKVLYRITGSATSADITFNTAQGSTGQSTVNLPFDLGFDNFSDDFLYISAQNNSEYGTITVEIYYEDNFKSSDSCSGSFCIATASSSI